MRTLLFCLLLAGCGGAKLHAFGTPCAKSDDCVSGFCAPGETGSVPFCSADCTGMGTGDACGGTNGRCIVGYTEWCWVACTSDKACAALDPQRPVCGAISDSTSLSPFNVCVTGVAPPDGGTMSVNDLAGDFSTGAITDLAL